MKFSWSYRGCSDTFPLFLLYDGPRLLELLDALRNEKRVIDIHSPRELRSFVDTAL